MGYDNWALNGNWHACECGEQWSDSDGNPCHARCSRCESLTDIDELDDEDLCPDCQNNPPCSECAAYTPIAELTNGMCQACAKENQE